ncbi:DUF2971 domain-containing protein [Nitrosomonas oligotropha]|uniref:DUF2971 domain-containing protein n=1 Tax=Nitrosomonas oligotropha TaxID=42354 RepID=UPI00136C26EA|nr:DUF2971 domain-containing protein [Nitrosomonas oligotropha]MXS84130.1 DUF2971 domain-containing protein [Nitrosomonas oligotropha]
MKQEMVHHYTSINTLALILQSKKIRFNRLDRVDDVSEAQAYGKYDLSKYLFVSCWTDKLEESIPQWHMYTENMTGVRISLPKDFMDYKPLDIPKEAGIILTDNNIVSPISWTQIFAENYFIFPFFANKNMIERKIIYVDDIQGIYSDAVKIDVDSNGKATMEFKRIGDLACHKHKSWAFQDEFRFVFFAVPSLKIPPDGFTNENFISSFTNHIIQCIHDHVAPPINYFDIDIGEALNSVQITLGPKCNQGHKVIVEALVKEYTTHGIVADSILSGSLRHPIRL